MGFEASPWAAVTPVLLDNTDPSGGCLSSPARPPPAMSVKRARFWLWYRDTMNGLLRAQQQPTLHRHHWQDVPGSLPWHCGHRTASIYTIQLPYPYKGCPQANHPVGMIHILHWTRSRGCLGEPLLATVKMTQGNPSKGHWGQALRNMTYLTCWYRPSQREYKEQESCK